MFISTFQTGVMFSVTAKGKDISVITPVSLIVKRIWLFVQWQKGAGVFFYLLQ